MKHKYAPIYNDPQEDDFDYDEYNDRIDEEAEERGMEEYYEDKFGRE